MTSLLELFSCEKNKQPLVVFMQSYYISRKMYAKRVIYQKILITGH